MKKKTVALLMACVMALGVAVGGTMAWLTDKTEDVTNTFTVGDINLLLDEADVDNSTPDKERDQANAYHFVPGDTMTKDPKVTVEFDSEACYLFIKVTEIGNIDVTGKDSDGNSVTEKALKYSVDEYVKETNETGWHPVPGHTGYWYRLVDKVTEANGKSFYILKGNEVTASEFITKDSALETTVPTLTFTAAAVQTKNLADKVAGEGVTEEAAAAANLAAAWDKLPASFKPAAQPTTPANP